MKAFVKRHGFLLGLLALGFFKLWVVHTEEIYGSSAEYDHLWYVGSAKHWYWGATYSWTGFVRPCAYPLFIAVVHFCGIPLRIAIELAQMAGYGVFIAALRRAGLPRALCLIIFALMILHPASLLYNNHSMSDSFYAAILPLALGGSLLTLFTRKFSHAVWTGVAYAVLWNTREESFLIPVILAVFFLLALLQRRDALTRKAHLVFWLKRTGALAGTLIVLVAAVYSANYRAFGSFAKSDMSSPAFEKAFKALLRIKPSYSLRYIAVNVEALRLAYEVSPTFAQLKPQFEALPGRNWTNPAFDTLGIREYGPWFMWALRNMTANAGYYKDPVSTNDFYRKIAREINQACDEGRIPSRLVVSGFLDPGAVSRIRYLPRSIGRIAKLFLFRHQKVMVRADTNLVPWMSESLSRDGLPPAAAQDRRVECGGHSKHGLGQACCRRAKFYRSLLRLSLYRSGLGGAGGISDPARFRSPLAGKRAADHRLASPRRGDCHPARLLFFPRRHLVDGRLRTLRLSDHAALDLLLHSADLRSLVRLP